MDFINPSLLAPLSNNPRPSPPAATESDDAGRASRDEHAGSVTSVAGCPGWLQRIAACLGGHDPAEPPSESELDIRPLRTWERGADRQMHPVDFDARCSASPPAPEPHPFHPVSRGALEVAMDRVDRQREAWLQDLPHAPTADRAVPKDLSLHPTTFYMSYKPDDDTALAYARQMARVGRVEGFRVVVEASAWDADDVRYAEDRIERENTTVVPLPGSREVWTEDYGEVTVGHEVGIPAFVGTDRGFIDRAIIRDRVRRTHPEEEWLLAGDPPASPLLEKVAWWLQGGSGPWGPPPSRPTCEDDLLRKYPDVDYSRMGIVAQYGYQESMMALGMAADLPVRENLTYIEGGNVLPGTMPDGEPYALIGKDSIGISRAVLSRDTGRTVSDAEVREAMSRDLGIPSRNILPVEQAGEFHIDMRMALLGPGEVLLNDAREAARIQEQWLREDHGPPREPATDAPQKARAAYETEKARWLRDEAPWLERQVKALHREAERRARYEDMAARDLEATGRVSVRRVPGVFVDPDHPSVDVANFLNFRSGVNGRGERFVVSLGGDARAEKAFAKSLLEGTQAHVDRVHFLDRALTPLTLDQFGGIKCRTKTEGDLVKVA